MYSADNDILTLVVPFKSNKYQQITSFMPETIEPYEASYPARSQDYRG